ncbi:MAG: AAA family ATPase, partial [Lachnospiraceae bacterium]|nr:AAA family ATPase [Lachnospiraceae bacterium]
RKSDLTERIARLEREIALLPEGSITKKTIRGKEYFYRRIMQDGKRKELYVGFEEVPALREGIERRKALEKELKALETELKVLEKEPNAQEKKFNVMEMEPDKLTRSITGSAFVQENAPGYLAFKTIVREGAGLEALIESSRGLRKRECISRLRDYIFGPVLDKVLILYGLRRTGKTTMIRQILAELPQEEFTKAAFIQVRSGNTLADVDADLRLLERNGYRYIFIDEVTLLEDFVEGAAIFSDIYAGSGMKIVLSGTDSLGFAFARDEQLYDRCILVHTTFIPYREFEEVLGISGIDEYIRYGGTMIAGGLNYHDDVPFSDPKRAENYIDTAIAKNIRHSLKVYQYGGHFRLLLELYEKNELTNVINRVVENINHSFTKSVIERTFSSHDISVTAANLLRDREKPVNLREHMNTDQVTAGIMKMLDILNKEDQSIDIEQDHMTQIREYLMLLDLIAEIDAEYLPEVSRKGKLTVITQPGLRYAQAEAIVENMLLDADFQELSVTERQRILDRLLSEIRGRMMEEIILLETKVAHPEKKVFKLQFPVGEFDMVVYDPATLSCEIYEVKYSTETVPEQHRHLSDDEKCSLTAHRYGEIKGKYVIYRGKSCKRGGIRYVNAEEYLKSLGKQ